MSAAKRPSTSSLRRFVSSRPYVPVAELRRRFGLDEPDAMVRIARNGTSAFIGLPAREATKLEELWARDELGVEISVDVHAPVVIGVYPMRIARYLDHGTPSDHDSASAVSVDQRPDLPAAAHEPDTHKPDEASTGPSA